MSDEGGLDMSVYDFQIEENKSEFAKMCKRGSEEAFSIPRRDILKSLKQFFLLLEKH